MENQTHTPVRHTGRKEPGDSLRECPALWLSCCCYFTGHMHGTRRNWLPDSLSPLRRIFVGLIYLGFFFLMFLTCPCKYSRNSLSIGLANKSIICSR